LSQKDNFARKKTRKLKYLPQSYLRGGQLGKEKADKQPVEAEKSVLAQQQAVLLFLLQIRNKSQQSVNQIHQTTEQRKLSVNQIH
jgi:hypothetical protein